METIPPVKLVDEKDLTADYAAGSSKYNWCYAAVESVIIRIVNHQEISMPEIAHNALLHVGRTYVGQYVDIDDPKLDQHTRAAMRYAIVFAQLAGEDGAQTAHLPFTELDEFLASAILSLQPDQVETIKAITGIKALGTDFFKQVRDNTYGRFGITLTEKSFRQRNYSNRGSDKLTVGAVRELLDAKNLVVIANSMHVMLVYGYEVDSAHRIRLLFWEPMARGRVQSNASQPSDIVGDILFPAAQDNAPIEEIFAVPL